MRFQLETFKLRFIHEDALVLNTFFSFLVSFCFINFFWQTINDQENAAYIHTQNTVWPFA